MVTTADDPEGPPVNGEQMFIARSVTSTAAGDAYLEQRVVGHPGMAAGRDQATSPGSQLVVWLPELDVLQ